MAPDLKTILNTRYILIYFAQIINFFYKEGLRGRRFIISSLDPRWKIRIRALFGLSLIALPGNLATLGIYSNMQGKSYLVIG